MTVGVVVMAYGTPATPEDIPGYYTHIRRGRPPTDEQLAELTARYEAIGGISPLAQRTRAQLAAIEASLEQDQDLAQVAAAHGDDEREPESLAVGGVHGLEPGQAGRRLGRLLFANNPPCLLRSHTCESPGIKRRRARQQLVGQDPQGVNIGSRIDIEPA